MSKVVKTKFNRSMALAVGCALSFTAYSKDGDLEVKLRPSTTLSAAANAANAAVTAANAAAVAANAAAAAAAAAAVEAINAILPASQRVMPALNTTPVLANLPTHNVDVLSAKPSDNQTAAQLYKLEDTTKEVASLEATSTAPKSDKQSLFTGSFAIPTERSLIGLAGTFEVPVSADARGEFAAGVAAMHADNVDNVEPIGSIDLAQAVKASLGFSREVLVASSRVNQARAQTGQAKAFLLPSLVINARAGREISSPGAEIDLTTGKAVASSNHNRADTTLTLKQPLVDLPSMYDWKRRKVVEKSREEGMRSSESDTYLATVNAYLALVSTQMQSDMAQDYEGQLQELFKYIEKRAGAGAASNSDKERVRARSLNAKSSRIELAAAHAAAGVEFVRLVNLAPNTLRLPDMEDVGITIVPTTLEAAMPLAIESNPDIAVLQSELKAAEIDQKSAKSRYYPRLDLEYSNSDVAHAGGASTIQRDQRLMVVMNWSLFNGGGDVKYGEEKFARHEELKYRLDDQRRRVLQSLSAQYATLESTRQRIAAGYRELESIATAARAMSSRMVSGNQSLLDMLDVYDRFYQARTRLVALHVQEMGSVAQVARLVQGTPAPNAIEAQQQVPNEALAGE